MYRSNADTLTFTAGTGITLTTSGDNITFTSAVPDYSLSGWTDGGTAVYNTTLTDNVGIGISTATSKLHVVGSSNLSGTVTLGSSTSDSITLTGRIANGTSIIPDTDMGSDLGSSSLRFNNLWVANINSNSSQNFSGQTTFSYAPTDSTITGASVIINPTTSAANGQLLAFALAGYQRAMIDEDGDLSLGYSDATSAPATDNPLMIYGHSGTNVANISSAGGAYFAGNVGIGVSNPSYKLHTVGNGYTSGWSRADKVYMGNGFGGGTDGPGFYSTAELNFSGATGTKIQFLDAYNKSLYVSPSEMTFTSADAGTYKMNFYTPGSGTSSINFGAVGPTNYLTVDTANGRVGVRNSTPTYNLDVTGTFRTTGTTTFNAQTYTWPGSQTASGVLTTNGSGTLSWGTIGASSITADSLDYSEFQDTMDLDAALILNQTTNTWSQAFTGTTTTGLTYTASSLTSGTANLITTAATAFTGKLVDITSTGGNANNTGTLLHVQSAATNAETTAMITNLGTGISFRVNDETGDAETTPFGDADTTPFVVDDSGRVGIGTTSPTSRLHIKASIIDSQNSSPLLSA